MHRWLVGLCRLERQSTALFTSFLLPIRLLSIKITYLQKIEDYVETITKERGEQVIVYSGAQFY